MSCSGRITRCLPNQLRCLLGLEPALHTFQLVIEALADVPLLTLPGFRSYLVLRTQFCSDCAQRLRPTEG